MTAVALTKATPRDREVQHVVMQLVEAHAVLGAGLREIAETRKNHLERLFIEWSGLEPCGRPDFLSFVHHRRNLELA